MNNTVTMELSKYDDMRWEIDYLNEKIKRMEDAVEDARKMLESLKEEM